MTSETGRRTTADPNSVFSRDDFAEFVRAVLADLETGGLQQWQNPALDHFLDALSAVSATRRVDLDDASQETATWQLFAAMIAAATGYE